jgi:hypothetical protein
MKIFAAYFKRPLQMILVLYITLFTINAEAATFTVTNTNDSGPGSLRQAIMNVNINCSGADKINFNISSTNASSDGINYYSIKPITALPIISCPVNIDGFTQPGAIEGAPVIEISGDFVSPSISQPAVDDSSSGYPAGILLVGRDKLTGAKLVNNPSGSTIRGLMINKFPLHGIYLYGSDHVTIIGNFIGLDVTGEKAGYANSTSSSIVGSNNSSTGILLEGSSDNYIGTVETNYKLDKIKATDRNVIGSSKGNGIFLIYLNDFNQNAVSFGNCSSCQRMNTIGSSKNVIQGNYVGLNKEGNCTIGGYRDTGVIGVPGICDNDGSRASATPVTGDSTAAYSLGYGIRIERGLSEAFTDPSTAFNRDNLIGGFKSDQGNVVAACRQVGAIYVNSPKNKIIGNIIGTNAKATTTNNITNNVTVGILIAAHGWDISLENNIVNNSSIGGIAILELGYHPGPHNLMVKNNIIGTNPQLTPMSATSGIGVFVGADVHNIILFRNIIAHNSKEGISIKARVDTNTNIFYSPNGISIINNSIFANGFGIDISAAPSPLVPIVLNTYIGDGVTQNDSAGHMNVPNSLQNFPILDQLSSSKNAESFKVVGSLDSNPNRQYLIQVFANTSADNTGYGQGQKLIGQKIVTTNANGHVDFKLRANDENEDTYNKLRETCLASLAKQKDHHDDRDPDFQDEMHYDKNQTVGNILTATATDLTTCDTSEFSMAIDVNNGN